MIPITLLTGFLGSGKTTLLARLLREPTFARTAVLINEFGEIGLDHELVEAGDESIVALSTGCLCCRISSNLVKTLAALDARRMAGEIKFDQVVIETSGLADPVPILQALARDPLVVSSFTVGGVVTLADAVSGHAVIKRYTEAQRQAALADLLLITKADLAQQGLGELMDALTLINPTARVMDVRDCVGDDLIRHGRHLGVTSGAAALPVSLRLRSPRHSHNFSSVLIARDKPLPAVTLPLFLEGLASHLGLNMLRAKGLVAVCEVPETPMVIHSVQHVVHKPVFLANWPSMDRRTRIVLIGHDLPQKWPGFLLDALEAEVISILHPLEPAMQTSGQHHE